MPRVVGVKAPKETITIRLSPDLLAAIREESAKVNWSISEFAEVAIIEGLVEILGGGLILEKRPPRKKLGRPRKK